MSLSRRSLGVVWKRTSIALVLACVVVATMSSSACADPDKHKRQIFREEVLPHSGGKIPEDAFRADRLALNRLNKDGISIPDGILLEARHHDKHPHTRHNSDLQMSVIKVILTPDGRYVPPEGRYHYENPLAVDSTYVIRPPIGAYKHELRRPQRPIPASLELPANVSPPQPIFLDGAQNSFYFPNQDTIFPDHYFPYYTPQTVSGFEALFQQFHHGRLIRESSKVAARRNGVVTGPPAKARGGLTLSYKKGGDKLPGEEGKDYPAHGTIPETSFSCEGLEGSTRMFADPVARCQVFHFCQKDGRKDSFLCPKGTLFNEILNHCDWWYNVKCG